MLAVFAFLLLVGTFRTLADPEAAISTHWVYALSPELQTNPVTVTVQVFRDNGTPWPNAEIIAYCEPWDFIYHGSADATGRASIVGPLGDWSVYARSYAVATQPYAGMNVPTIACAHWPRITESTTAVLRAKPDREFRFITTGGIDLLERLAHTGLGAIHEACRPRVWFTPDLPSPVGSIICGAWDESTPFPVFSDSAAQGVAQLTCSPTIDQPGYALTLEVSGSTENLTRIDETTLARLNLTIDNLPAKEQVHLGLQLLGGTAQEIGIYIPRFAAGSNYQMRLTPGYYWLRLYTYAPIHLELPPGSSKTLRYGGPFETRLTPIRWDRGYFSAWADVVDRYGNPLQHVQYAVGHCTIWCNGTVVYDSDVTRASGRVVEIVRDWGQDWQDQKYDYEFRINSDVGQLSTRGSLVPGQSMLETVPAVYSSEHFSIHAREPWADGRSTAQCLEQAYQFLADRYGRAARPSSGERYRIYYTSPTDVAWSAGDGIGLDIYSAYWFDPMRDFNGVPTLLHEFGHSYAWPPNALPALGGLTGESIASMLMWNAVRGLLGERSYHQVRQTGTWPPNIPELGFILGYLEEKYGTDFTYQYFKALHHGEGNCRDILLSLKFLETEAEKAGALMSFLCDANLGWLYRWVGFPIPDEVFTQAVSEMKRLGAVPPPILPGKASLISPSGTINTPTPSFTWNAVSTATWYQLWVNDANAAPRIQQWFTAKEAGCQSGTGFCSVTPVTAVAGACQWWIQTWNSKGYGPWSDGMAFTVSGASPPGKAILTFPSGSIATTSPTYIWYAVPDATWYQLWVNDSSGSPKIQAWFTAAQTGCASGTGNCSITASTPLSPGACRWWIQTWNDNGHGPWSDGMQFTVTTIGIRNLR